MYKLPETLRPKLQQPLGPVLDPDKAYDLLRRARYLITVGDVTTIELYKRGVVPRIAIVDYKTKRVKDDGLRQELLQYGERRIEVDNPAGEITTALWDAIAKAIGEGSPTLIRVNGEEDLAALPAILLAPEGAFVAYGQPDEGVVAVEVKDDAREAVKALLAEMEVL